MTSTSALPAVPAIAAVAPAASTLPILRALGDVRQQRHLARPLHGGRDLHLVAAARAGDAAAADLALLGDVAPELVDVLVVDLRDLFLAEEAVAAPDLPRGTAGPPPLLLLLSLLSRHASPRTGCRRLRLRGSRRSPAPRRRARTDCLRRHHRRGCRGTGRSRR